MEVGTEPNARPFIERINRFIRAKAGEAHPERDMKETLALAGLAVINPDAAESYMRGYSSATSDKERWEVTAAFWAMIDHYQRNGRLPSRQELERKTRLVLNVFGEEPKNSAIKGFMRDVKAMQGAKQT